MRSLLLLIVSLLFFSCQQKIKVDTIYYNANIYTVDEQFSVVQAMAVKDGKVYETGTTDSIFYKFDAEEYIDINGKFIYPGFNDAHAHLYGLGENLRGVNLIGTTSFTEIVEKLVSYKTTTSSSFILGRGWDQNDWEI